MKIREFIQTQILLSRLKQNGVLVVYDPDQRYRELCLELKTNKLRVIDASESSITSRAAALAAPIYWPISTPSCSDILRLYYHLLNDQTLFSSVNDFVDLKLKQVSDESAYLRQKKSRSAADEKDLERLTDFERELKDFREELLRVAKFWKPNLNDGVEITTAPLWKLFQHKPWQNLEAGEYDWAHLAYSIRPEQVREKCKTDKSLTIAHDLEQVYVEPKIPLKKKRSKNQVNNENMEGWFNGDYNLFPVEGIG